jgi:hypothetical protein
LEECFKEKANTDPPWLCALQANEFTERMQNTDNDNVAGMLVRQGGGALTVCGGPEGTVVCPAQSVDEFGSHALVSIVLPQKPEDDVTIAITRCGSLLSCWAVGCWLLGWRGRTNDCLCRARVRVRTTSSVGSCAVRGPMVGSATDARSYGVIC